MRLLTAKQEAFAQALAKGAQNSEAYRATNDTKGMKPKTVHEAASRLAHNRKVAARVAELRAPATLQAEQTLLVGLQRTLFENARIGFSDIRKILRGTGADSVELISPDEWDDDTVAAVASIERVALFDKDGLGQIGYTTKVKLWDKGEALDALMKNLGGYKCDKDQKKDILADLPFETLLLLEERLRELVEDNVGTGTPAQGAKRPARAPPQEDPA